MIPIMGFLIFVHELGHFAVAKAFGIRVNEFGFGLPIPPRIFGFRRGETMYSIYLNPLGGFVRLLGEEDPSHPRSLAGKSRLTRFLVLAAGSFMNLLVPIVVFSILFAVVPPRMTIGTVRIQEVWPGSPAQEVGLRSGDAIMRVDDERVTTSEQAVRLITGKRGVEVELLIMRGATIAGIGTSPEFATYEMVYIVPRVNPPRGQGPTGISVATFGRVITQPRYPFWEAIPLGVQHLGGLLVMIWDEVFSWIDGTATPQFAGPIGIAQVTSEVSKFGAIPLLNLTAFLSINLAIINILPLPALDGGRILFLGIEWARRGKRISPQREGLIHLLGFALIISLVIIISYFDILRLLRGESF